MKASVIIPSYNASERLYFNLLALNMQDYPMNEFEVIVIDNGSTDQTGPMLAAFKPDYPLKFIRLGKNRGIAHARNQGILKAACDTLIFHDSDMIASKEFIRRHVEAQDQNMVICGIPWKRIYSFFYKNFRGQQLAHFNRHRDKYHLEDDFADHNTYQLITVKQIYDDSFLNLSFDLDSSYIHSLKNITRIYGLDLKGYHLPWRFFFTNNASVNKNKVIDAGLFDENNIKYGFEDIDLGFRLYKSGCFFKLKYDIVSVHQEHSRKITISDIRDSVNYICNKYHHFTTVDMILACLSAVGAISINQQSMNGIMNDIYRINSQQRYHDLLSYFVGLLQIVCNHYLRKKKKTGICSLIAIYDQKINKQIKEVREQLGCDCFIDVLYTLKRHVSAISRIQGEGYEHI